MDDAQPCGRAELGPVGRAAQPVQVVAQEGVHGCAAVHDGVREDDGRVAHAVARLARRLDVLQDLIRQRTRGAFSTSTSASTRWHSTAELLALVREQSVGQ